MGDRYVIVGGGIVGASVAYHLAARADAPVTLLERGAPAAETTSKSVAQFGFYGDGIQYRMKRYGTAFYADLLADASATVEYEEPGILAVATEPDTADRLRRAAAGGDADVGYVGTGLGRDPVEYVPGSGIDEALVLPPVDTGRLEGALFRPRVGFFRRPRALAVELLDRAADLGAHVRTDAPVTDIVTEHGRVIGVRTADGAVDADEVVAAAGPWTPAIAASVGIDLPVAHSFDPVLVLRPADPVPYALPIVTHCESPFAVHRRGREELYVSYNAGGDRARPRDPDAAPEAVPAGRRDEALAQFRALVPGLRDAELVDEWVGVGSRTPDGNPIVGPTRVDGFSTAVVPSGIQLAPAVGNVIASRLVDGEPVDHELSVGRFDGDTDRYS